MKPALVHPPRQPSLGRHLWLLFGLRMRLATNGAARRPVLSGLGFLAACVPALAVGALLWMLMQQPVVRESTLLTRFILALMGFVTGCVWCLWPILSAGVDDHSELSRFVNFPLPGVRLLLASTLAAMLEPRALFFSAPLVGAALGMREANPGMSLPWVGLLLLTYLLMCASFGRVGLHLMLNLLSSKRSAQLLGGGMVLFLLGASLLPPVDVRWLEEAGTSGLAALGPDFLTDAAFALSRVPTGWIASGLLALASGRQNVVIVASLAMLVMAGIGFAMAYRLLYRFHRGAVRGGARAAEPRFSNPFTRPQTLFGALVLREAVDLWNHPRARLLACVPFVLAILIKLLSGRALFEFALGERADVWLAGGLGMYGALVMTSTFAQNAFGYDGHGLAAMWAAPVGPGQVLRAKNLVHAAAGLALAAVSITFVAIYFGGIGALELSVAMVGCAAMVGVLVIVGNQLSLTFPVKFHADLRRRDKLPLAASLLGIVGAAIGGAPFALALRMEDTARPGAPALGLGLVALVVIVAAYALLQPDVERRLVTRRERILAAVTRD